MAAAADSVSRSSRHRQYQTDNQEDGPDDQRKWAKVGTRLGRTSPRTIRTIPRMIMMVI